MSDFSRQASHPCTSAHGTVPLDYLECAEFHTPFLFPVGSSLLLMTFYRFADVFLHPCCRLFRQRLCWFCSVFWGASSEHSSRQCLLEAACFHEHEERSAGNLMGEDTWTWSLPYVWHLLHCEGAFRKELQRHLCRHARCRERKTSLSCIDACMFYWLWWMWFTSPCHSTLY